LLYDRTKLFDLVASLAGLAMQEPRRVTEGHRSDPPVVVIGGGRGMGKTAALKAISNAYGNRVPRSYLDLANRRYAPGHGDPNSGTSPLLRVLQDLQWDLEQKVRRGGELRFPRLSLVLLAIATWQPDEEITLAQARKRLAEAGESVARIARVGAAARSDWANDWVSDVVSELAAVAVPAPAKIFVKATVRAFTAKALGRGDRESSLAWHEDFDPATPGDGYQALIAVSRDFHLGGDFRARAEETLVAAFLADVRAGCQSMVGRLVRAGFPLALLDNIHAHPVGLRLLELVLSRRAQPRADPLVIVAAGPENLAARLAALVPADRPVRSADLLAPVELTRLDQHVVLRMLDRADPRRLRPDLPHLIHRLTDGLPLGVDIITRAVAVAAPAGGQYPIGPALDGSTVLALPAPLAEPAAEAGVGRSVSVADRLVERLLPDPAWRFRLTVLSAARDVDAAQALVTTYLHTDQHRLAAAGAELLLRENGWAVDPPDPAHFIAESFLRILLLEQLRCRSAAPTSAAVHTALRDLYPGGTGRLAATEPARLWHCLALGECGHVVRRFRESFEHADAGTWLTAIQAVITAPYTGAADHRQEAALGDADDYTHDEVHRSVNRLLHAAWLLTDPLVAPDSTVAGKITEELNLLAQKHGGNGVLAAAATSWPARLLSWQQTDEHPVSGE
jgi:hypothetical protein